MKEKTCSLILGCNKAIECGAKALAMACFAELYAKEILRETIFPKEGNLMTTLNRRAKVVHKAR
jgi:hypothetical protein